MPSVRYICTSISFFPFPFPNNRLHQRGLKTLKDRTRLQNVEHRLGELSRDITYVRKELSFKPG